ncbi:MAG: hypothetical protein Q4D38_12925 [Planctomycetia bacterium]|nr:hypothetical protein [Planctomycetia bacterium]
MRTCYAEWSMFDFPTFQGVKVVNESVDLPVEGKCFTLQHLPFAWIDERFGLKATIQRQDSPHATNSLAVHGNV